MNRRVNPALPPLSDNMYAYMSKIQPTLTPTYLKTYVNHEQSS